MHFMLQHFSLLQQLQRVFLAFSGSFDFFFRQHPLPLPLSFEVCPLTVGFVDLGTDFR